MGFGKRYNRVLCLLVVTKELLAASVRMGKGFSYKDWMLECLFDGHSRVSVLWKTMRGLKLLLSQTKKT